MSSYLNVDAASTVRSRSRSREGHAQSSRDAGSQKKTEQDRQLQRRSVSSTRLEDEYDFEEEHDKPHMSGIPRSTASQRKYTVEEEKIVRKKLDRYLVLFLAFLYLLSFLDRSSNCYALRRSAMLMKDRYWKCSSCRSGQSTESV